MATITKRGDKYRIRVYVGEDMNGKQLFSSTSWTPDPNKTEKQNKKALELFALQYEKQVKSGQLLSGDKLTYKKYAELWFEEYAKTQYTDSTIALTKKDLFDCIVVGLGNLKMSEISPLHIQRFFDSLSARGFVRYGVRREYTQGTLRRIYNILSSSLSQAVYWQIIYDNPCNRVKPPKVNRIEEENDYFNIEEAKSFLAFLDEPYKTPHGAHSEFYDTKEIPLQFKAIFYLAMFCGFRRGEILALKWEDVDFEEGTIKICKSLSSFKSGIAYISTPKNKTSNRTVSAPDCCMSLLSKVKYEELENRIRLGSAWRGEGNVFSRADGYYMHMSSPYQRFKETIKRYNESHEDKLPDIRFHGLRHTMATLMISQGEDIKTVSSRLGHADTSTTLDIYTHAIKSRDREASNNLERMLSVV